MVFDKKAYMKEYNKEYHDKNRDKIKEYKKEYRDKNREYYKEYDKVYQEKNKEKRKEYNKEYRQTETFKKSTTIGKWKRRGLIHEDYNALYEKYINTTCCDVCNKEFKNRRDRCLDHDHITGEFRQILCRACNTMDSWKNKIQNNNL